MSDPSSFFFSGDGERRTGRDERDSEDRAQGYPRSVATVVSQQTVSNCVVFCFLYVRWSELWNRHRTNFGNKITVYRRYPFEARDGNVTFPLSFFAIVTSCFRRRITPFSQLRHRSFSRHRMSASTGV